MDPSLPNMQNSEFILVIVDTTVNDLATVGRQEMCVWQ